MDNLSITILCENTVGKTGLLGEHGLSFYVQAGKETLLFDTGGGYTLFHNSAKLNISLSSIDYLVLSHGHYDHTGGMKKLFKVATVQKFFAHPNVFRKRYIKDSDGEIREIGYRGPSMKVLSTKTKYIPVVCPTKITKDIIASGPIPRIVSFESVEQNFFSNIKEQKIDSFDDDQCLIIEERNNYIVLLGCCHSGLINTLTYLRENVLKKTKQIIIIGGLHLFNASEERLHKTMKALSKYDIYSIYPCHCSGYKTLLFFNKYLNIPCFPSYAGFSLK